MIQPSDFPYRDLSIEERLLLVEEIWDSIVAEEESVPLTDAQRTELRRRLAAYQADKSKTYTWEEVRAQVTARLRELRA